MTSQCLCKLQTCKQRSAPPVTILCKRCLFAQVLFNPQAQHLLHDGVEPLKIVVRLEEHATSLRHIRQLKSSSIGRHDMVHKPATTCLSQQLTNDGLMYRQDSQCEGHSSKDKCCQASDTMHDIHVHQMWRRTHHALQ